MQSISLFFDVAEFADFRWKNVAVSRTQGYVTLLTYTFLGLFWVTYDCAKFQYCRISVTNFKEVGAFLTHLPLLSPSFVSSHKKAHPEWS